jgi:hypothetical protein
MQRHTIYHVARTIESDSSLATESSLPHTPAVMSLGVKLAVGIHDSLPAAAELLGFLSQGVTAGSSQSAEFMDVAAALPDQLDELGHINLLSTAGVNWVLLSVDHLGGLMGPVPTNREHVNLKYTSDFHIMQDAWKNLCFHVH